MLLSSDQRQNPNRQAVPSTLKPNTRLLLEVFTAQICAVVLGILLCLPVFSTELSAYINDELISHIAMWTAFLVFGYYSSRRLAASLYFSCIMFCSRRVSGIIGQILSLFDIFIDSEILSLFFDFVQFLVWGLLAWLFLRFVKKPELNAEVYSIGPNWAPMFFFPASDSVNTAQALSPEPHRASAPPVDTSRQTTRDMESSPIDLPGQPPESRQPTHYMTAQPPESRQPTHYMTAQPPESRQPTHYMTAQPPESQQPTHHMTSQFPASRQPTLDMTGNSPAPLQPTRYMKGQQATSARKPRYAITVFAYWLAGLSGSEINNVRFSTGKHRKTFLAVLVLLAIVLMGWKIGCVSIAVELLNVGILSRLDEVNVLCGLLRYLGVLAFPAIAALFLMKQKIGRMQLLILFYSAQTVGNFAESMLEQIFGLHERFFGFSVSSLVSAWSNQIVWALTFIGAVILFLLVLDKTAASSRQVFRFAMVAGGRRTS